MAKTTTYQVEGMCCASEVKLVEGTLQALTGIDQIQVSLAAGSVRVSHRAGFDPATVDDALSSVGLSARPRQRTDRSSPAGRPAWYRDADLIPVAAAAGLTVVGLVCSHVIGFETAGVAALISATAVGGLPVFKNAARSVRRLDLDINVLMTVAVIGALILGEWLEAAMVVGLFGFAEWLEDASMARAREAIGQLMKLAPDQARVLRDGREVLTPVDEVQIRDHVVVLPGERIPVDGEVERGESEVDQSPITGESNPVLKQPDGEVFAGTLNQQGSLEVRVDHAPGDTTLDRVIEAVETAQQNRSDSERFVEQFARCYTPAVLGLAVLAATVPPLLVGALWGTWFYRALVLLVIACPCALVLATPITTASAVARAARDGILIKGGRFLEELGRVRAVAFDKTGTLTAGEHTVTEVVTADGIDEVDLVGHAALAESRSEHYLAGAITGLAEARNIDIQPERLAEFEAQVGRGVRAEIYDHEPGPKLTGDPGGCCSTGCASTATVEADAARTTSGLVVGHRSLLANAGVDYAGLAARWTALEQQGQTVVGVGRQDEFLGLIALEDTPRPAAVETLRRLEGDGVDRVYMLTGDNQASAGSVADQLEIGRDSVLSELLPADKVGAITDLASRHEHVAMVGDGINDAPALAAAPVGVAMGAAGADIALDTAHVALMADDLKRLPKAIELGARTRTIVIQNIVVAIAIKVAVFALAATGIATLWMAVLADMGTSLVVIFNGMRMLRAS